MKERDLKYNRIIKRSYSITNFRNLTMLFCNLFFYFLPPSVSPSVNEDPSEICVEVGKCSIFSTVTHFLLSRHAFVKNGTQCSQRIALSNIQVLFSKSHVH